MRDWFSKFEYELRMFRMFVRTQGFDHDLRTIRDPIRELFYFLSVKRIATFTAACPSLFCPAPLL